MGSQSRLMVAAQEGNITSMYELLVEDHSLLDSIGGLSFRDTPLHVAASLGETRFALELMVLKPSLGRKLNQDGLTPMHLSLENGHIETVRGLLALDKELVRVKGRGGMTPLHHAVVKGRYEILGEMLLVCPDSAKDLTNRRESVFHLAVKNNHFKSLRVLVEHIDLRDSEEILLRKDDQGRIALHLMVMDGRLKMIRGLCRYYRHVGSIFGINVKDDNGQTAMDIVKELHRTQTNATYLSIKNILHRSGGLRASSKARFIMFRHLIREYHRLILRYERISSNAQNALLVVAVLITTVTFQVGVNPPGGIWQDTTATNGTTSYDFFQVGHYAGESILFTTNPVLFVVILVVNYMGFLSSVFMILFLTLRLPMRNVLRASLLFMTITYILSLSLSYIIVFSFAIYSSVVFFIASKMVKQASRRTEFIDDDNDDNDELQIFVGGA